MIDIKAIGGQLKRDIYLFNQSDHTVTIGGVSLLPGEGRGFMREYIKQVKKKAPSLVYMLSIGEVALLDSRKDEREIAERMTKWSMSKFEG